MNTNIRHIPLYYWLFATLLLWVLGYFLIPIFDYTSCQLCDAHQYQKLFQYFKDEQWEPIKFPYYLRPAVPFLVALIFRQDSIVGFQILNVVFALLSVWGIYLLWNYLKLPNALMIIGFGWLFFHWVGLVRFNIADFLGVDVPLYLIYALTLLLYYRKQFKWFYFLTPISILVKESFIIIILILIIFQIVLDKKLSRNCIHMLLSVALGWLLQQWWIWSLPTQEENRSSLLTLLYHIKITILEPSRLIRWFAAIGSAFGAFPLILIFRFREILAENNEIRLLAILSMLFIGFGLTAGGDMTRIMYLGFPLIMTLSLWQWRQEKTPVFILVVVLSLPFLRPFSWNIQQISPVEYAPMREVLNWASYYLVTIVITFFALFYSKEKDLFGSLKQK